MLQHWRQQHSTAHSTTALASRGWYLFRSWSMLELLLISSHRIICLKLPKATLVFLPCLTTSFQTTTLKTQITELKIIDIFPQHMELYHLKRFSYILTVNCALNARKLSKWQDGLTMARYAPEFCRLTLILVRSTIFYHSNMRVD